MRRMRRIYLAIPKIWDTLWGHIMVFSDEKRCRTFVTNMNNRKEKEAIYEMRSQILW